VQTLEATRLSRRVRRELPQSPEAVANEVREQQPGTSGDGGARASGQTRSRMLLPLPHSVVAAPFSLRSIGAALLGCSRRPARRWLCGTAVSCSVRAQVGWKVITAGPLSDPGPQARRRDSVGAGRRAPRRMGAALLELARLPVPPRIPAGLPREQAAVRADVHDEHQRWAERPRLPGLLQPGPGALRVGAQGLL